MRQVTSAGGSESAPVISPDGKSVAFVCQPNVKRPVWQVDLCVTTLGGGAVRNLTESLDREIGDIRWAGRHIYFSYDDRGLRKVARVAPSGGPIETVLEELGGTSLGDDGAKGSGAMSVIEQLAPEAPADTPPEAGQDQNLASATEEALRAEIARREAAEFASAAESLRQAMQSMPELAELSKQLIIDQTPEGLRIQLVDQEGRSMFDQNSAQPNPRAQLLLRTVSRVITQLPNRISVTGHTSAVPGSSRATGPNDWNLSSARANASRLILQSAGVDPDRVYQVAGKAGSDPLYPDDPTLAGNRRIAIVLLREAPVLPMDTSL
jgi:chemotaxis protein MotB